MSTTAFKVLGANMESLHATGIFRRKYLINTVTQAEFGTIGISVIPDKEVAKKFWEIAKINEPSAMLVEVEIVGVSSAPQLVAPDWMSLDIFYGDRHEHGIRPDREKIFASSVKPIKIIQ